MTPETKTKLAERMRRAWQDPEMRRRFMTAKPKVEEEPDTSIPDPSDPKLVEAFTHAIPLWRALGDDMEAVERLAVAICVELPLRRALLQVRGYITEVGPHVSMLGHLAAITDAFCQTDPELGAPEDVCARLAIFCGLEPATVGRVD